MSSASEIVIQSGASKKGWRIISESVKKGSVDFFIPDENGVGVVGGGGGTRYTKQGDDSHFKRDLGFARFKEIMLT